MSARGTVAGENWHYSYYSVLSFLLTCNLKTVAGIGFCPGPLAGPPVSSAKLDKTTSQKLEPRTFILQIFQRFSWGCLVADLYRIFSFVDLKLVSLWYSVNVINIRLVFFSPKCGSFNINSQYPRHTLKQTRYTGLFNYYVSKIDMIVERSLSDVSIIWPSIKSTSRQNTKFALKDPRIFKTYCANDMTQEINIFSFQNLTHKLLNEKKCRICEHGF